jgi:hypothetical protein
MSRLWDRMCQHGVHRLGHDKVLPWPPWDDETTDDIVRVVTDNVTDYYYGGTDQEYWNFRDHLINLAPPWPAAWIETRRPTSIRSNVYGDRPWGAGYPSAWGVLMMAIEREQNTDTSRWDAMRERFQEVTYEEFGTLLQFIVEEAEDSSEDPLLGDWGQKIAMAKAARMGAPVRWMVDALLFLEVDKNAPPILVGKVTYALTDDGSMPYDPDGGDLATVPTAWVIEPESLAAVEDERAFMQGAFFNPIWLALTFSHCANVEVRETQPPPKLARASRKRGRPLHSYHVIDIDPARRILRGEGREGEHGTARALHICRGHFADYRQRGVFGKHKKIVWRPMHTRGSAEIGRSTADYRVKAPAEVDDD